MTSLHGKFEFKFLRGKIIVAEIDGQKSLEKILGSQLLSQGIDWRYDPEENQGQAFVGMFRKVCEFRKIGK